MLRGNSASGKSSVAAGLCDRFGRGLALVGQDNLRRIVLRERDRAGAADIGLIDLTVRYALDAGYHVVLEGILYAGPYGAMLAQLRADHLGPNRGYYLDVPFAETLARHATKPIVNDAGEEALRDWYRERDVLPGGVETVIGADSQIVSRSQLRACCHHRATTECASAKHPLRLRSGPHRPPRRPVGTPTLDVCPETGRARLSYRRAEEIFEENTRLLANPLRLTRGHREPGRLDPAPAPPQGPDARRRERHLHPDAAGPLPPRLGAFPGAVRPPRRRRYRPECRRTRPRRRG